MCKAVVQLDHIEIVRPDAARLIDLVGRIARHIESAYATMCENQRQGRAPQSFSVAPIDAASR